MLARPPRAASGTSGGSQVPLNTSNVPLHGLERTASRRALKDAKHSSRAGSACPLDADGATVSVGDVVGQTRQVVANLITALAAAGAELSDVVKTTVYVASADRDDLGAVWDVVRTAFGDHDAPSTLLGVSVLGYPDQLVEVEAVAVLT
ncbi:RidA family protein [Kineococcus sp. R86509]|uniref:RidA family protein n=1 Tax=Kineococcus sp. R86509 TaxID=3093851 RepID=UPI0036D32A9F